MVKYILFVFIFISENFLKKIKNNFLVCDQYKIMQRIVCWFLFHVHKNVHVSSNAKNFLWTCWFLQPSSLPDLLEKSISIPPASSSLTVQRLAIWFYTALQWNCSQWALNSWIEWLFLSSAFLILLCVCNIYTIEQPFLGGVSSLKDVILCHNCECSHITLKVYLLKCTLRFCLQNASGGISSLGFLFYPSVLCSISGPKFQTHTFNYLFDVSA